MADKTFKGKISAKGTEIGVLSQGNDDDYISLTDIARYKNPDDPNGVIANWLRNRNTIEFLGIWEQLYNPDFKPLEFEGFKQEAGLNAFTLSPMKWVTSTNAIGIIVKAGRGGGTFAHKDIAFEFASWISAEFKLYIIKDYQRLKADENSRMSLAACRRAKLDQFLGAQTFRFSRSLASQMAEYGKNAALNHRISGSRHGAARRNG